MTSGRTAAVTLTAASALALAAPTAVASVAPDPVLPGQSLTISDDKLCDMANGARASSSLFGNVVMSAGANHMFADVKVPSGARTGSYAVRVECGMGGKTHTFTARISGAAVPAKPAPAVSGMPTTVPAKGAKAGAGGSVGGMDTDEVAGGAALLAAAGGAAAVTARRRPRGKH